MKDQKNNPDHHEKDIKKQKRKWFKPEILEEDFSNTNDPDPPTLPEPPEQTGS